jgi:hypothetical protein
MPVDLEQLLTGTARHFLDLHRNKQVAEQTTKQSYSSLPLQSLHEPRTLINTMIRPQYPRSRKRTLLPVDT